MGISNIAYHKTLKLTNACSMELQNPSTQELGTVLVQMENYIKSKGVAPIGPLIQCTIITPNADGEPDIKVSLIRQTTGYIHDVEFPYAMESLIRCKNCLYVRFIGMEHHMKFAYDKLTLAAFEENIPLVGKTYTVFVTDGSSGNVTADIFMARADT